MGAAVSMQIPVPPALPFTGKNYSQHMMHARKMVKKTHAARRKVWESLQEGSRHRGVVPIEHARQAHILAEATRSFFKQLVENYPTEQEVWHAYARFHELVRDESGVEECHKRLAYLKQSVVISPRGGQILRVKTPEEEEKDRMLNEIAPHEFLCPITLEVMRSPVTATDGFTYEEYAIKEWLSKHNRSPLTNLQMESKVLKHNDQLHASITKFIASH